MPNPTMVKPIPPAASGNSSIPNLISAALSTRTGQIALVALLALFFIPRALPKSSSSSSGGWLLSSTDQYASTPFCSPTGQCGEESDKPSPRTAYSAKSKEQYDLWWHFHAALIKSAAEYATRRKEEGGADADAKKKRPLILLGDSITESYLGTEYGRPSEKFGEVMPVLGEVYGDKFDPLVLGVSGDQTQHLLWRLGNGELRPEYANDPDAVFVMLIGTNNLGSGHLPGPAAKGTIAAAEFVLENASGRLVLLEVLPRGDSERVERLCPPRCDSKGDPFASFMPAVKKVNLELRNAAPSLSKKYDGRLSLVDCGGTFLLDETAAKKKETSLEVNTNYMPDRLHPNAEGHRLLAKCVLECIGGKC